MGVTPLISFNWGLVMIAINILILYLIMKKFFFEKIHNFMEARKEAVEDSFAEAKLKNEQADEIMASYQIKLEDIENEGREIIKKAKIKADAQARDIINEADQKATIMLQQAEKEIERQQRSALADMQDQIAGLAILAAEKILEKQLDAVAQKEYVGRVLEEAGNVKWQN